MAGKKIAMTRKRVYRMWTVVRAWFRCPALGQYIFAPEAIYLVSPPWSTTHSVTCTVSCKRWRWHRGPHKFFYEDALRKASAA